MTTSSPVRELRLPADRFYWAILDTASLPRARAKHDARLGYLFESVLPAPIESIHAVYRPLDRGRVLACGIERGALASLAGPGLLSLGPDALPGFVGDVGIHACSLNLLVREFEPREIRRSRARAAAIACGGVLLVALAVAVGQLRRTDALVERAASLTRATAELYARVLPPSTSSLPQAARLTAELRSLDRTRGNKPGAAGPEDIAPTLAAVLASWPEDLHLTTDALSASPTAITLAVRVADESAVERLERELTPPPGWRASQPNVQRERDGITVRVRMEPGGAS